MEVAAELRKPAGRNWVGAMEGTNQLLGAVVGVIHPTTFRTGSACVQAIATGEQITKRDTLDLLTSIWTSPLPAASIINNRQTPLHRDNGATYGSMDFLTSVGPFAFGRFMTPTLGLEFLFKAGTVIGLLGRIVPHAAEAEGERMCFAQYLRENILTTLNVGQPGWVNITDLIPESSN
jgi:hypothetical protein